MTAKLRWLHVAGCVCVIGFAAAARVGAQGAVDPANVAPAQDPTPVPAWGKISADNACYVRLPDMPGARYGGFGGVNPDTGVVAFAGGAEKRTDANTITYHDMYGIDLKSASPTWSTIPYGANTGYTRDVDKGCREGATVQLPGSGSTARWLSVFGKDGCDNGAFDSGKKGGDIKELSIGSTANGAGVAWVPNSGAQNLPAELLDNKGKLVRLFAAYDGERDRVVFGQGTYDDAKAVFTNDEIYSARRSGNKWQVTQLRPAGPVPSPRYGTCATHVFDRDSGLDGLLVLGGQEGGEVAVVSYKEVWWLDFSVKEAGQWREITDLFSNMDDIGYRREGSCAYNPDTKHFYSWMGRASSSIPDGASRSAGMWRSDLSALAEALRGEASLTWERLAKDNLPGIKGRHLIPTVYDSKNNRMFVMGGRNNLDEYADAWVIYPDVTGAACENLDVRMDVPTPEPTTPPMPTRTPDPAGSPPPPPTPTLDPTHGLAVCDHIQGRVPNAAINAAVTNADQTYGYNTLCYPSRPQGPFNQLRSKLSLRNTGVPYHPVYNGLVWKCGCP